ncbi:MAG: integrase, partial [Archaeoglobaceae archaeon]|nr:integrase [Archaeoglobaceae archaeon]
MEIIGEFPLEEWRKKCKIPRYGSREVFISDEELRKAYSEIKDEDVKLIFELMVYSGIRLKHLMRVLNSFDSANIVKVNDKVYRYPTFR